MDGKDLPWTHDECPPGFAKLCPAPALFGLFHLMDEVVKAAALLVIALVRFLQKRRLLFPVPKTGVKSVSCRCSYGSLLLPSYTILHVSRQEPR